MPQIKYVILTVYDSQLYLFVYPNPKPGLYNGRERGIGREEK